MEGPRESHLRRVESERRAARGHRAVALGRDSRPRAGREDPLTRAHAADTQPSLVQLIPNATAIPAKKGRKKKKALPTRRSPREVQDVVLDAIQQAKNIDMIYVTRGMERKRLTVKPERIATNAQGQQVLVASDIAKGDRFSYQMIQIERMDLS